jgi:hypothetical protein
MRTDGPGGRGSAADGPFAHYPATPGTIYSHADTLTKQGALAGPPKEAPQPVRHDATQVMRAALVGGGCVRYFGNAVSSFNRGVDKLNDEYATAKAKAAKLPELNRRYNALQTKLDVKATKASSMLKKGPDDEKTVLTLFGAGALPITAPRAFPEVNFKKASWRKALAQYAKTVGGRLPMMTDQGLADWMNQHPELTCAVEWLRKQNGIKLSVFELDLVTAQARVDAMARQDGDDSSDRAGERPRSARRLTLRLRSPRHAQDVRCGGQRDPDVRHA